MQLGIGFTRGGPRITRPRPTAGGETRRVYASRCPTGAIQQRYARRTHANPEFVECYFPPARAPAPVAAPPPPASTIITTVSPAIQAQISPQISPAMAQQQASPGAAVTSRPGQVMPGGQTVGPPAYGISADEDAERRELEEGQRRADERRAGELRTMQTLMQESAAAQRTALAEENARLTAERQAAEDAQAQAELMARESAGQIPAPPSFLPVKEPAPFMVEQAITPIVEEKDNNIFLILLLLAGGTLLILGKGKGKRQSTRRRKRVRK